MSVSIKWNSPDISALVLTFTAPWQWRDYDAISETIQQMFESTVNEIDLIIDLQDAGQIPDDVFVHFRDAYADAVPNLGQYIFVGASSWFIERLTVVDHYLSALGGTLDYRFADTLDQAQLISQWNTLIRKNQSRLLV